MTAHYSEADLIAAVTTLTPARLSRFVRLGIITPLQQADAVRYREIDLRRVTLLTELTDDLELNEDGLVIVMNLLDQLHGARTEVSAIFAAIAQQEPHVRTRITASYRELRRQTEEMPDEPH